MITIHRHKVKALVLFTHLWTTILQFKLKHDSAKIINIAYEYGTTYRQLHVHMIVKTPKALLYWNLPTFNGFKIHYNRLYTKANLHNAQLYLSKDKYESFAFSPSVADSSAVDAYT